MADIAKVASPSFSLQKAPRFGNLEKYKPVEPIKGIERRQAPPKDFADELETQSQTQAETNYFTGSGQQRTVFEQEAPAAAAPPAPANDTFSSALSAPFLAQQFANSNNNELPPHRNFGTQQSKVGIQAYETAQAGRDAPEQPRGGFNFMSGTSAARAYEQTSAANPSFAQAAQAVEARNASLNFFA